jgi:hypothetical protein
MRCNAETDHTRKNQGRRRLTQNKRLFKEFPWLWAIKNAWDMAREDVFVGTNEVGGISLDTLLRGVPEDCFVWVISKMPGSGDAFYKIEPVIKSWAGVRGVDTVNVAFSIYHQATQSKFSEVIYIVHCADMGTTRIFRPKKKGSTFNLYLDAMLHG